MTSAVPVLGASTFVAFTVLATACDGATSDAASGAPSSAPVTTGAYRVHVLASSCAYAVPEDEVGVVLCAGDAGTYRANIPLFELGSSDAAPVGLRQDIEAPGTRSYPAKGFAGPCAGQDYRRTVDVEAPTRSGLVVHVRDEYGACAGSTTTCEIRYALEPVRTCSGTDAVVQVGASAQMECACR